jgi:cephalosporin-C deacetylase-like acetyl esterase
VVEWRRPGSEPGPRSPIAIKRTYNVDENRVVVAGVSDGGTGAYYVAMRDTTPYASFPSYERVHHGDRQRQHRMTVRSFPNNLRQQAGSLS